MKTFGKAKNLKFFVNIDLLKVKLELVLKEQKQRRKSLLNIIKRLVEKFHLLCLSSKSCTFIFYVIEPRIFFSFNIIPFLPFRVADSVGNLI